MFILFLRKRIRNWAAREISAFIVEKNTPGFIVGKDEKKMGLHGSRTVQLTFEDMHVPAENLLGAEGEGFKIAMANLDVGRIGIATQALGIAEAALSAAQPRMRRTVSNLANQSPANKELALSLADMATSVEAAKLLVYRAA